ncbi:TIGR02281 family clan AA aspartic protease [Sphingomonas sp. LY54]|uniref:retropepsin-like aspartic protease family protein n=1 Tax=Sphingomonas sp. LY54 TaxID=3095343 RepID=UPI002D7936C0|nr:TIGR02281 family clan AA aspartic protease [Sphingomonas sp. LY54]WRP27254.1 TIGR02281 family clan AA aspartic protease [Sphingomonas sp. LY54]
MSVAILAAGALFSPRAEPPPEAAAEEFAAAPQPTPIGNGAAATTLRRAPDGHFYADAQVNGARLRLLVDTGASGLVLTRTDAQRAGVAAGDFTAIGRGAGGTVRLMPTTLGRVALGPLSADNVPAMVAEDQLPVSLMGQSFLARIGTVTIRGDEMVLR